jgi:hypothetical protein
VQYAVKFERASKKKLRSPSEHESNVLQILADANVSPRIPRVIDYGYDKLRYSNALVLDLLGADLHFMRRQCRGRFSIKTTLTLPLGLFVFPTPVPFVSDIAFLLRFLLFGIYTPKTSSTET